MLRGRFEVAALQVLALFGRWVTEMYSIMGRRLLLGGDFELRLWSFSLSLGMMSSLVWREQSLRAEHVQIYHHYSRFSFAEPPRTAFDMLTQNSGGSVDDLHVWIASKILFTASFEQQIPHKRQDALICRGV